MEQRMCQVCGSDEAGECVGILKGQWLCGPCYLKELMKILFAISLVVAIAFCFYTFNQESKKTNINNVSFNIATKSIPKELPVKSIYK